MTPATVILTLLMPGLGHFLIGRFVRGLVIWLVYMCSALGAIACGLTGGGPLSHNAPFVVLMLISAACWVYAVVNIVDVTFGSEESTSEECDEHFRQGVTHYLRGELVRAKKEFQKALSLNRRDLEARLHLGMVYAAEGRYHHARRAFKRCLALDHDGKWHWELQRELRRLNQRSCVSPSVENQTPQQSASADPVKDAI